MNTAAAPSFPQRLLVKGGHPWVPNTGNDLPPVADILVEHGRIRWVGSASDDVASRSTDAPSTEIEVIDARGKLVMPGFVNAHYHSYDTLAKGLIEDMPFDVWALHSQPAYFGPRSRAELRARTLLGAIECLKSGITTVQDMCTLVPQDEETLDIIAAAYDEVGIRVVFSIPLRDIGELDIAPFLAPGVSQAVRDRIMGAPRDPAADLDFVERQISRLPSGQRWHWGLSVSGPQRASQTLLEGIAALSRRRSLQIFSHVYETKAQTLKARVRYAATEGSMIRHLDATGLLGPRLTIAHGVWLDEAEIKLLAARDVRVVLNPISNMKLKSGVAPIASLQAAGVTIGLGCDNCSCGDCQNIFQAMKMHCLLAAVSDPEPSGVYARHALAAATTGGAAAVGLADAIGRIGPGFRADLTLIDLSDVAYLPLNGVARQLVFCETGRGVDTVIVEGRVVLRHGRPTTIDDGAFRDTIETVMPTFRRDFGALSAANADAIPWLLEANRRMAAHAIGLNRFLAGESRTGRHNI
jgi:cytosine/adenosine deaminase-related metal-dependent hydrolase